MIKRTVRDQVYPLELYLKCVNEGDICENADVQRLPGSFDNREINEIVYTVLTSDHIPELILAECNEDNHTYIADGLQRTTMLKLFRYGNYKITSAIDHPIVEYSRKKRDADGNIVKNRRGQIEFEDAGVDIRNKSYEMLPDELKKEFNTYQIRVIIHEDCTMERISNLIKRYNYQRPMTSSQKAFTYMPNFAVEARSVSNKQFFIECEGYSEREKMNGTVERIVAESVMCMFHFNKWKKSSKAICEYLNENSSREEFGKAGEIADRLNRIMTPCFYDIFISKNSFLWFALFYKFTGLGLDDVIFSDFICKFRGELKDKVVDKVKYKELEHVTYSKLDKESGTKDKVLVLAKLRVLETLMNEFLEGRKNGAEEEIRTENFIEEQVGVNIEDLRKDLDFYNESLDDLTGSTVKDGSKLLDGENRLSLLAMMVYSYKEDIDLDEWLMEYAKKNDTYFADQKKNYLYMIWDLKQFLKHKEQLEGRS